METVLHTMYVVAIKDTAAWEGDTPAEVSMIGFWNLVVVWLKVRDGYDRFSSPSHRLLCPDLLSHPFLRPSGVFSAFQPQLIRILHINPAGPTMTDLSSSFPGGSSASGHWSTV